MSKSKLFGNTNMTCRDELAPRDMVARPEHINRGPGPTKLSGKGKLAPVLVQHPNHKSSHARPSNVDEQKQNPAYPAGMKRTNSTADKSNPVALPSKNRSNAGKASAGRSKNLKGAKGSSYSGPKGMKGSGNMKQAQQVSGTSKMRGDKKGY